LPFMSGMIWSKRMKLGFCFCAFSIPDWAVFATITWKLAFLKDIAQRSFIVSSSSIMRIFMLGFSLSGSYVNCKG
jgi:hydrogenase/urease accessory protein HupE